MPKQTIKDILEFFREEARNNRDLGDKFERLIAAYLTKDPYYVTHFSDVWLWMEWPGRNNMGDTGIDLVAQERATGDFTAIQCKFLDPAHWLQKEDIDSFFTASGKKPFTQRMIICTTDKWGRNALDACENQQPPVTKPVFDALFEGYEFTRQNPVSKTMQKAVKNIFFGNCNLLERFKLSA